MTSEEKTQSTADSPRFGVLAIVCLAAVVGCGFVGWLVSTYL